MKMVEILKEFDDIYHNNIGSIKRWRRGAFFASIIRILFEKYGSELGYDNLSSFKKDLIFTQKKLKSEKRRQSKKSRKEEKNVFYTEFQLFEIEKKEWFDFGGLDQQIT